MSEVRPWMQAIDKMSAVIKYQIILQKLTPWLVYY